MMSAIRIISATTVPEDQGERIRERGSGREAQGERDMLFPFGKKVPLLTQY
jgi:hypothetical protein